MKKQKISKGLYWTPRVLSIIFLAFLVLFSFDVFSPELTIWQMLFAFFMHNLPVIILAVILWISWNGREWLAGSIFILGGLLYTVRILMTAITAGFELYYIAWIIQIAGIAFFTGILFLLNWIKKKK
ncbi:MAG: hypothetical protein QXD13_00980 [Candidatus Pacearchaeota archaeon]